MNEHRLEGCRTQPLSSYLKSVGVLAVVTEQLDAGARAWWHEDTFVLRTTASRQELDEFFLEGYQPTPIVAPWNGGSGFDPGNPTKEIAAIEASAEGRLHGYREVIAAVRSWPEMPQPLKTVAGLLAFLDAAAQEAGASKEGQEIRRLHDDILAAWPPADSCEGTDIAALSPSEVERRSKAALEAERAALGKFVKALRKGGTRYAQSQRSGGKEALISLCRSRLPESVLRWLDAACALGVDGSPSYNPLLGSGGNDGRLEFSRSYMGAVGALFLDAGRERRRPLLDSALWGRALPGLTSAAIGQYDPGRSGGPNQGMGLDADCVSNPWDFVLQIEGALLFASSIVRRGRSDVVGLASPFTVRTSDVGYPASSASESSRAETWMPVWSRPLELAGLRHLLGEGRAQVGRRAASSGLDFARAVSTLGVDRGIDAFVRYVYVQRRGKNYAALPAGRIEVRHRPQARLLDELEPALARLDAFLRRFPNIPASLDRSRRQIDEAMYACALQPEPCQFEILVRALGRVEAIVAQRDRSKDPKLSRPLTGLSPDWIEACDDGGAEVRLAAALASIRGTGDVGPLRANLAGVDARKPWLWAGGRSQTAWTGSDLCERLGGVLSRRMLDAGRLACPHVPTEGRLPISADDVTPFVLGLCDDTRIEELLWGFMLIDWRRPGRSRLQKRWSQPVSRLPMSRTWALLKLLHQPAEIRGVLPRSEPRVASLLIANRTPEALDVVARRLRVSGLEPLALPGAPEESPSRLRAALLIPIRGTERMARLVLKEQKNAAPAA